MNNEQINGQGLEEIINDNYNPEVVSNRKKRTVTATTHPLPHISSNIEQHLKIIKAYIISTNEGKKPVMYKDFENLVDFHYTYVSANNKFLEDLGLIEKTGSHGMYIPTRNAIDYQLHKNWNQDEKALDILRGLVERSWFWQSTKQVLLMRDEGADEQEILNKLGADAKANPEKHRGSLRVLLNYLEYVGLIKRDDKTKKILASQLIPKEISTNEATNEKQTDHTSDVKDIPLTASQPPIVIQQTPTEQTHYREEPGHYTLRVKLDDISISLLEEEIIHIRRKYDVLLQKTKRENVDIK